MENDVININIDKLVDKIIIINGDNPQKLAEEIKTILADAINAAKSQSEGISG
jgi:hypothetical protein